jgi:hypothetical protein
LAPHGQPYRYFEKHPEWRGMRAWGKLALVQDPAKGGLLSGGILDMIAVKHTPVRPVARQQLTAESLKDASMTVNVDADSLTADQKEILRAFARGGGTLLTGPPGWRDQANSGSITLDKAELERLNDIWRDVNSMVGRRNLGVRLFNVTSMLSNLVAGPDGQPVVLHLVNYSDYPVENVAVHFLGTFKRAVLLTPEGIEKKLEVYETEGGGGVDLEKVGVVANCKTGAIEAWSNDMTRREWLAMIAATPLLKAAPDAPASPVSIAKCASYDEDLTAKLGAMFTQLGGIENLVRNKTVTVKVNMTGSPGQRVQGRAPAVTHYTHPKLLGAAAYLMGRAGAKRIRFVESSWATAGRSKNRCSIRDGTCAPCNRPRRWWSSRTPTPSARARSTRASRCRAAPSCTRPTT